MLASSFDGRSGHSFNYLDQNLYRLIRSGYLGRPRLKIPVFAANSCFKFWNFDLILNLSVQLLLGVWFVGLGN